MPPTGTYILSNVGFSRDEKPLLLLQSGQNFIECYPLEQTISLIFDTAQRHCTGWRNITTGERFVCPDWQLIEGKYEQCPACQKRTGFNPAFYHATDISDQQQARNTQPHLLYLAYFSPSILKVGISHAGRGDGRLLEQGARSALLLETFSSAAIARQYEARIAKLDGISEAIQLSRKIASLSISYDDARAETELRVAQAHIEAQLDVHFSSAVIRHYDASYLPTEPLDISGHTDMTALHSISGIVIGMIGSLFITRYNDRQLILPLKKFVGYELTLQNDLISLSLPARQTTLF